MYIEQTPEDPYLMVPQTRKLEKFLLFLNEWQMRNLFLLEK